MSNNLHTYVGVIAAFQHR